MEEKKNRYGIDKDAHYFILMHPLENCLGIIFYTSSNTREKWVECEVVEEYYKVDDGYKVELRSIELGYGKETFYQCDFASLMKSGMIVKKDREDMHVEEITFMQPLYGCANLVTKVYVLV